MRTVKFKVTRAKIIALVLLVVVIGYTINIASHKTLDESNAVSDGPGKAPGTEYRSTHATVQDINVRTKLVENVIKNTTNGPVSNLESKGYDQCRTQRLKRLIQRCYNSGYRQFTSYDTISESDLRRLVKTIVVDTKHQLLVQTIPKTGSGSWRAILIKSTNVKDKYALPYLDQISSVIDIREYLRTYMFVLTVRHPIARLESAYENKFVLFNDIYMRRHGLPILKRYRYGGAQANKAQHLASDNKQSTLENTLLSQNKISDLDLKNITRPTFHEFIQYVIDRDKRGMDPHWDTYEESAHPCAFIFSHIARTETTELDMNYVTSQALSQTMQAHTNQSPSKELDLPLFEQLPNKSQVISKIRERYSTDMHLFGYKLFTDTQSGLLKTGCEEYGSQGICC